MCSVSYSWHRKRILSQEGEVKCYALNMKKFAYYFCPHCSTVLVASGNSCLTCCSETLSRLVPVEAGEKERLSVRKEGDEILVSSSHPMTKDNYIAFVAYERWDGIIFRTFFPEWNLQTSFPYAQKGRLIWYSTTKGAFFQNV